MDTPDYVFERSFYYGNLLIAILYGVQISLTLMTIYLMYNGGSRANVSNKHRYACYCVVLLICSTIGLSTNGLLGQMMWIEHRNFPGGPPAWFGEVGGTIWYNTFGTAVFVLSDIMAEALLLYRCYVIWNSNPFIIIFPVLIFLGSIAMSIMTVVESALPGSSFFIKQTTDFSLPWLSLTSSLNAILTLLIAGRILWYRRKMNIAMSDESARIYSGVIALLVESAAPFTVLGITLTILLSQKSPVAIAFTCVWGSYVAIAPVLIILRVAMGQSWTKDTLPGTEMSMKFAVPSIGETTRSRTATVLGSEGALDGHSKLQSHDTLVLGKGNAA